jgi:hypothetical protein
VRAACFVCPVLCGLMWGKGGGGGLPRQSIGGLTGGWRATPLVVPLHHCRPSPLTSASSSPPPPRCSHSHSLLLAHIHSNARKEEEESTKELIGDMFSALWFGCSRVPLGSSDLGSPGAVDLASPLPSLGTTPRKGGGAGGVALLDDLVCVWGGGGSSILAGRCVLRDGRGWSWVAVGVAGH